MTGRLLPHYAMTKLTRIVEVIPNFSEGRNTSTVEALVRTVKSVGEVYLLDRQMDSDHHRAVLTLVGTPERVAEAAFQLACVATDLIDLREHEGGHPFVGATDVMPFVPIQGIAMDHCVQLARSVGERIGRELKIPVFLYEQAATQSHRVNLEAIRKGGLEALAARMASDPAWEPDFGPRVVHPTAGVTAIGARFPLVAFNVNLATNDLSLAKTIARRVRSSSGGLPSVKAIGVSLPSRGRVQVSMNLTNVAETSLQGAFEEVKRESEHRGVSIDSLEVVGLAPAQALEGVSEDFLRMAEGSPLQVLETRIAEVMGLRR